MIKDVNTLILYREDLALKFKSQPLQDININSFKNIHRIEYRMPDLIIFMDDFSKLETKILKNRYGAVDK